ncbi:MAG TPA: tyrosine-type recombinase/integrase [Lysobacter sp.]|jgi:integrase|nr:tyrosine-type recombinase/integrase [Lysobacter sp.]
MRAKITKAAVDALGKGAILADSEVRGFVARRLPSGIVTYGLRYRVAGRQRWLALGIHGKVTPDRARKLAKKQVGKVADDRNPAAERQTEREKAVQARANTVDALFDSFLERHVRGKLRTAGEFERIFKKYVRPRIGAKSLDELRRRDIVEMLDAIEDQHGPVMADRTLARVRKAFNWQAARDDSFVPPIVRGMARTSIAERARERVLDDAEIRAVWKAADKLGTAYARMLQFVLLTATRLREAADMNRKETNGEGAEWTIPAARHKSKRDFLVPLSQGAQDILAKLPRKGRKDWVFTTDGDAPISGFSKWKAAFDKEMLAELHKADPKGKLERWTHHDLRRTARSLMSRAGCDVDHAERALGHVVGGVRGVYDRHEFKAEKARVFEALAAQVERILNPTHNVVPLTSRR